ncbi:choice-of-anchor Q domain-containing protein [Actinospongicola halichondriae]|uniref:choice-of-anchor Q domain-containing protein n=1 Tax=Actinospongicola halichondriae TaxID=3236844 RepID=UPI003D5B4796
MATISMIVPMHTAGAGVPATINVDTTDDEVNDDGDCSLREAVISANDNVAIDDCEKGEDADIIVIPAGTYVLGITQDSDGDDDVKGDLDVYDAVTLQGAGAASTVIDANGIDRVIETNGDGIIEVVIDGLTITGGDTTEFGGGSGGGIAANDTALTVRDSVVTENEANGGGGGIDSDNDDSGLLLERSVVSNNTASSEGGGIRQDNDDTSLTVVDSTISGNTAARGGGVHVDNFAVVSIEGSTISGNSATGDFGDTQRFRGDGPECGYGGGFSQDDGDSEGNTIVNSTFSGNVADCGGGGLHMVATTQLTNVTIFGNSSPDAGNVLFEPWDDAKATFVNSIVAEPLLGDDCLTMDDAIVSAGGNIQSDDTCGFDEASDQTVADVMLGALADNGGATMTHLPLEGSAAIDGALDDPCPEVDQRDLSRPIDGDADGTTACDVGAVEVRTPVPDTTPTTEPDGDVGANAETPAAQPTVASPVYTG